MTCYQPLCSRLHEFSRQYRRPPKDVAFGIRLSRSHGSNSRRHIRRVVCRSDNPRLLCHTSPRQQKHVHSFACSHCICLEFVSSKPHFVRGKANPQPGGRTLSLWRDAGGRGHTGGTGDNGCRCRGRAQDIQDMPSRAEAGPWACRRAMEGRRPRGRTGGPAAMLVLRY